MVASIAVSWFVGLIFLFILLLYTQDIQSIEQTQFEMPIAQLFLVRTPYWNFKRVPVTFFFY